MLQNFKFTQYRFTYTVQEPLRMPPNKANVFRSRLGYTLRNITCIGQEEECRNRCEHPAQCVYSQCFETPVPDDSPILRGQPFAPHPFILEPPLTGKQDYAPGDTFTCNLILIGNAINVLPWMAFTFNEIGKKRIGLHGKRGKCQLDKIESLPADDSAESQTIYTAETETLTGPGLILRLDDVMRSAPNVTDTIELNFLTPTSIKVDRRWMRDLPFELLIRNLLRRIRFLSYFHCGEELEVDAHALLAATNSITHTSRLRWMRKERWSSRAKRTIPMDGFIGTIRFEGELAPFLPLLCLGEYLHIGHHTAFGFGKYRIHVPTTSIVLQ